MALLTQKEIHSCKKELSGWELHDNTLQRKFEFVDFVSAMGFVTTVALMAEHSNHHPDIDIRWNIISLSLTTHSEGGITEKDISLAKKIDSMTKKPQRKHKERRQKR
jgi:4a-hydroxytetrahydrobiopterin dehydratase